MAKLNSFKNIILFGATVIIFLYICSIGIHSIFRYNAYKQSYDQTVLELTLEKEKNQTFKHEISDMKSMDYWELQGKKRLGFVKKNEVAYVILK